MKHLFYSVISASVLSVLSTGANAQSSAALAKKYFERFDYKTLDGIGVQIVEGDHPGSIYYAAVLRQDVDYVNNIARSLGLKFRFRQVRAPTRG